MPRSQPDFIIHLDLWSFDIDQQPPPGLLAQVVPGLLSDLQLRASSPCTCINNYPAKKKKKGIDQQPPSHRLFMHLIYFLLKRGIIKCLLVRLSLSFFMSIYHSSFHNFYQNLSMQRVMVHVISQYYPS